MEEPSKPVSERERAIPTAFWIAAFALAASACGWVYDAVWSIAALGVFVFAGAVLGLFDAMARRGRNVEERVRALFRGACLGVITWVFSLFSWFALEIA